MGRIDFEIGLYDEHIETALKWYGFYSKGGKHPSKLDEETYNLLNLIVTDLKRADKEEEDDG